MRRKRVSLDAMFDSSSKRETASQTSEIPEEAPPGTAAPPILKRPGVKQHTAYLPLGVHEQLRRLAFEENRKIHDYLVEGIDRVFADRGLPAIKDIK
jgi:hypothetical protein